jgi:hypothetical protein
MSAVDMEYVQMPVRRSLVPQAYRFLADLEASAIGIQAGPQGWTLELLKRQYDESPDVMKRLEKHLANNPGMEFKTSELQKELGVVQASSMPGVFGAFGRRVKNRYGMGTWPFDARWDPSANTMRYSMSPERAKIIAAL